MSTTPYETHLVNAPTGSNEQVISETYQLRDGPVESSPVSTRPTANVASFKQNVGVSEEKKMHTESVESIYYADKNIYYEGPMNVEKPENDERLMDVEKAVMNERLINVDKSTMNIISNDGGLKNLEQDDKQASTPKAAAWAIHDELIQSPVSNILYKLIL